MGKKQKSSEKISAESILSAYRETVLRDGKRPASVYAFCQNQKIQEREFYEYFGSFESLEKAIWINFFESTRTAIESDADYSSLSAREKVLTFYFAFMERLKGDRSFVLQQLASWKKIEGVPVFIRGALDVFESWINQVLNLGKGTHEVASRPFLEKQYAKLFQLHFLFILHFWVHDHSANFEKTDAAIEKSVTLAFDLVGKGVLDNALDFGKFLFQQAKAGYAQGY